jgi:hypothetical protein
MPAAPGAVAPTAPTTAVIGAAPAPAPLLPAGTLTAERAATAATYLQHAAELIDKALGDRQGTKDLKEAGTVQIDRATLDDIRTAIGQVMSMLK